MYKIYPALTGLLLLLVIVPNITSAQSLPVGTPIEDTYRREQLLGKVDSNISFTIRPLFPATALKTENIFDPDGSLKALDPASSNGIYRTKNGQGFVQLLPINWQQQYNTHNPYGWNDGSIIPATGYQSLFTAGVYAKYKFLSIQLNPEFVYAQNKSYDGFTQAGNDATVWKAWYFLYNKIDLPERFGTTPYSKLLLGQSSVSITFDPISFGLSTENMWWGPGIRNSLLMSNTSTGFAHLTLNTTRPIKTFFGSFEGQLIAGKLVSSGYTPLVLGQAGNMDKLYIPKPKDWRYLNALAITYHPKWVPGLFLGLTRAFYVYHGTMGSGLSDYLPVFIPYVKKDFYDLTTNTIPEDTKNRDELTSVYLRYLLKDINAEFYFEYGRGDNNWDTRDLFLDPQHSRSYIFGFRKLYKVGHKDDHIQVGVEVTQLGESADDAVERSAGNPLYQHHQVFDGYTNNGEILGAGIGPGSNLQTFNVSWFRGMNKIGIQIERLEHNADFYYTAFTPGELRRHWVDFSLGLNSDWVYKHFIISGKLTYIDQLNYQWQLKDDPKVFYWDQKHYDANNIQAGLSVTYRF